MNPLLCASKSQSSSTESAPFLSSEPGQSHPWKGLGVCILGLRDEQCKWMHLALLIGKRPGSLCSDSPGPPAWEGGAAGTGGAQGEACGVSDPPRLASQKDAEQEAGREFQDPG